MNDSINRQAAIDVVHKVILEFFDYCEDDEESPMTEKDKMLLEINKKISSRIKELHSVDAVEVVRCKDCKWCHKAVFAKYWNGEEIERCYCDIHKRYTIDDYFCGDGERRDDD